jgi:YesN/AraC family two-component response regulator
MNKPLSEKEKLLTMLTEIYDQLEELESVLEASFSDLRTSLNQEEQEKLTIPVQKLSAIENKIENHNATQDILDEYSDNNQVAKALKLELGF